MSDIVEILADPVTVRPFGLRMQRLERLFAINETLRRAAPRRVSASRLADDFGVSRRTIERDIAALLAAGVPLYAERGRSGGHISLDELGAVVVTLTPAEVTALLVALAAGGPDMPYADAGKSATARLLDGLPARSRLAVDELRGRVRSTALTSDRSTKRIRRTVESAVQRGVIVNLDYEGGAGISTTRAVEALGFYNGRDHWFLIGWCHLRNGGRIFRLDRISRATLTKQPNEPRDVDETLGWVPDDVTAP